MAQTVKVKLHAHVVPVKQSRRVVLFRTSRRPVPLSLPFAPQRDAVTCAKIVCAATIAPVSEAEHIANERRRQESGTSSDSSAKWQWSLNWDPIIPHLIVGSCPRSSEDVDTILSKAGADAIVCLQCNDCLEALNVDLPSIRQRAAELGMTHVQVAIRDFDRPDQARMLPEAVLQIALLVQEGKTVYIHCTAGINRAPLAAIGFLSFVQGMDMEDAVNLVKARRPQARPYEECLKDARANLLLPEKPMLVALAKEKYEARVRHGDPEDGMEDWLTAEKEILQMLFRRRMAAAASHHSSVQAGTFLRDSATQSTIQSLEHKVTLLQQQLQQTQDQLHTAVARAADSDVVCVMVEEPGSNNGRPPYADISTSMPTTEAELMTALKRLVDESSAALAVRSGCLHCTPGDRPCGSLCFEAHPMLDGKDEMSEQIRAH